MNAVANVDEVATYGTLGVDVVGIEAVDEQTAAVGTRSIVVIKAFGVAIYLAVDKLKGAHSRLCGQNVTLGLGTCNSINCAVENQILEVDGGNLTCGLDVQAGHNGFLAIYGGLTNEPQVALDSQSAGQVVGHAVVVGQHEFHVADGAGGGCHNGVHGVHKVGALGRRTGEGGHATTIASLAVDEAQLVVHAGLQACYGGGACGNHLGRKG